MAATLEIRPQPKQLEFLSSPADIAIYGGAAGGGKSWALLLEPLRHVLKRHNFPVVLFRRQLTDAKKPGSTWDQMGNIYPRVGGTPRIGNLEYRFPQGGTVTIGHLDNDATVHNWMSAEIPLFLFEELTHFTRLQFFYMLSRNRSMSGVAPYVRATCNPDADSWVAEFIAWWINQDTGIAIPERSGVLRWFARLDDKLFWADSREELMDQFPESMPLSVTFIYADLNDNQILKVGDPSYRSKLLAMPRVERERLLGGNWKIRPSAGLYFQRAWCEVVDFVPAGTVFVRGWDLAATDKTDDNDPDRTTATKVGRMPDGRFIIAHHMGMQGSPAKVEQALTNIAGQDGKAVRIALPQDPGQAGKSQAIAFVKKLAGYNVRIRTMSGDKITRFGPFSAQAEAGNVVVLRGDWNDSYFAALEGFPDAKHDDEADSTSEAFECLTSEQVIKIAMPYVASRPRDIPG